MVPRSGNRLLAILIPVAAMLSAAACGVENSSASPAISRLRRMLDAEATLAYQGTKETEFAAPGFGRLFTFVTRPAGEAAIVESMGEPAGRGRAWSEGPGRLSWLPDLDLLLRNYRVDCDGRERVAGREGIVLVVRGLHGARPGVRLVVDEITGLLLAAEFRDFRGERTFSTRFLTLLIGAGLPPAERPPPGRAPALREPAATASGREPFTPLSPRYLPEGFVPVRECVTARFAETVYSDGIGWISLTQTPADPWERERVVRQRVDGSRVRMRLVLGGVSLRLVGRLAPDELLRIFESLGPGPGRRISTAPDSGGTYNADGQARLVLMAVSEDLEDHRRGETSD
jgi:negative regulator of sigma E activity